MKKLILLFFCFQFSFAQKETVKVGIFVTNLYDFNLADGSYVAEFWTWSLYKNNTFSFKESQEVSNAKKITFSNFLVQKKAGLNWEQKKATATILKDWDARYFPFDKQVLTINLEENFLDATDINYIPDASNSGIKDNLELEDWQINSFEIKSKKIRCNTTYGDPEIKGESFYPAVCTTIAITRQHS